MISFSHVVTPLVCMLVCVYIRCLSLVGLFRGKPGSSQEWWHFGSKGTNGLV